MDQNSPAEARVTISGDLFELVTLDNVADLIFAEVAQLDAALEADAHLFHVVLETAQRRKAAVVDRLAPRRTRRSGRAADAAIGDETAGTIRGSTGRPVSLPRGR
jgi:hypothetical protein